MVRNSNSYFIFKKQTEDLLNFIVTVFYGVSSLRKTIKDLDSSEDIVTPRPEFFVHDKTKPKSLYRLSYGYKSKIGAYGLLSLFSFFEAYVKSILDEIITFQGGLDDFIKISDKKAKKFMEKSSEEINEYKKKLQRDYDPKRRSDYVYYAVKLSDEKYVFPSQLFSSYGIRRYSQDIKRLQTKDIPKILQDALHMEIQNSTIEDYRKIKDIRNEIAHGRRSEYSIKQVMEFHTFLKEFAKTIDNHITENYFIYEKYG